MMQSVILLFVGIITAAVLSAQPCTKAGKLHKHPDATGVACLIVRGDAELNRVELSNFPALTSLTIKNTSLTSPPEDVLQLLELREFQFRNNALTQFPKELGELPNLEVLDLGQNPLEILPENFSGFNMLRELHLWSTQVDYLPESLRQLPSLQEINLRNNPIHRNDHKLWKEKFPEYTLHFNTKCDC